MPISTLFSSGSKPKSTFSFVRLSCSNSSSISGVTNGCSICLCLSSKPILEETKSVIASLIPKDLSNSLPISKLSKATRPGTLALPNIALLAFLPRPKRFFGPNKPPNPLFLFICSIGAPTTPLYFKKLGFTCLARFMPFLTPLNAGLIAANPSSDEVTGFSLARFIPFWNKFSFSSSMGFYYNILNARLIRISKGYSITYTCSHCNCTRCIKIKNIRTWVIYLTKCSTGFFSNNKI